MSSSHNSDEETSSHSSKVLEDVNKHINEAFDLLNRETNRVRKEMEALDEAAKKLEHVHFSKTVKLNVGGHLFSTSLATLNKDPGSMLHAMFSGRFETKPSEDGSYFIDRDGTHFRYILNYLRTGQLIVPKDEIVREELLAEAEFYQVEGIIKALTPKQPRLFEDSVILSSDQRQILINWLKETRDLTNASDKLLYRASRNGWAATNFHSCCDNKGPTVTVVKSTGNYIFGGYTDQHWDSSGAWKSAPDSFLFSLVNPSGLPPTKMPLIAGQEGNAIIGNSSYGPIFGSGHDLLIGNAPNKSNNCSVYLNSTYQCPAGQDANTFLAGNGNFRVSEMEVFGFEK
ncbi:hypothetical protein ACROYT_G044254 [Oculina patagonica]